MGDDLFDDKKERVKFFEYIIPVIPFINSSNADDQLRTLIKEAGLDESIFSKEFISDVTTFIDDIDMRLLTNIFHEFIIYRKTLKPEFIKNNDELFAMITYKSIDPKDFNILNRKEGKLFGLINNKGSYIKKIISKIEINIDSEKSKILEIENHTIIDFEELKSIYFLKILSKLPTNAFVDKLIIANDLENLIETQSINYKYQRDYSNNLVENTFQFKFSEIENEVNPDYSYEERVELIQSKNNNKIDSLRKELEKLKSNKSEIENWDLKQIFNEVDITEYLKDFPNNELLRNFMLNGYINENYNDYISLFHEVSITKEDYTFQRNVKGGYSTDFNFKLSDKIENLIEKIDVKYFERETILNFDLLDFLGNNCGKYSDKYDSVIRLLSNEKEKSIQFIDEYLKNENRPLTVFIEKLVENWKGFWDYIYSKSNHSEDEENKYLELIIRFSKVETILKNQNNNTLRTAIEEKSNFLSLIKSTKELDYFAKIKNLLKELNIEFEKLENPNEESEKLFDYVYNNNHYRINKDNLLQMFLLFGNEKTDEKFNRSNYSTILNSESKPLIDYINSNIKTYVDDVYLKLENNKLEYENSLIKLLNDEDLSIKSKVKIIQKVETKVSDLKKINDVEIKTQLLINNKVTPNWGNAIDYYTVFENSINENLIKFLELGDVNEELSRVKLLKENEIFEGSILLCNEITDETYGKLLNSIYFRYHKLEFENLNEDKVLCLTNKILTTTKVNYDLLKEHFPNNHITLIERDFKKFIEKSDDFETEDEDVLLLLKSNKISIEEKFSYAALLDENLISGSQRILKAVADIILQKSQTIEFSNNTLEALIGASDSKENKIKLINLYSANFDNDQLIRITSLVSLRYTELFKKQHKPTFEDTPYNQILFSMLKKRDLIKSHSVDKKDKSKIRVVANY